MGFVSLGNTTSVATVSDSDGVFLLFALAINIVFPVNISRPKLTQQLGIIHDPYHFLV
jgi:hypothetical protein